MTTKLHLRKNYSFYFKHFVIITLCVFLNNHVMTAQMRLGSIEPIRLEKDVCIYRPDPKPKKSFIPVTNQVKLRMANNTSNSRTIITGDCSTFDITYTGFTETAETAFSYAVQIWANSIVSSQTIKINADFAPLGAGILGGAGADLYYFITGPNIPANTLFPSALADALLDQDNNTSGTDINATFSSTFPFYFGTDGNTPTGQYDFVSVVLHEIGHGLGIAGFGRQENGLGALRVSTLYSGIWDQYIENGSNTSVLNYADPSIALLGQFTGGNLFSNGPETTVQNGNVNPKTYAPNPFQTGSSYSHWDEATYPAGNANSLMTPQIGAGEAIHDPGKVTLGFMQDMFWTICGNLLSTNDASISNVLTYYPNPVKNNITITALNQNRIQKVKIFDILGKKIIETSPNNIKSVLNLTSLENGIYIVKVSFEKTVETFRVLKN